MAHLNAAGITRLVTKLKDRFAALAHTHAAATDITGQLPVANGGTGASTASGARTNLDAAQDNSSGITLAAAASNISTLLATTGIASTPSGKTLQGQISTLQDSVSGKLDAPNGGSLKCDTSGSNRLFYYDFVCKNPNSTHNNHSMGLYFQTSGISLWCSNCGATIWSK